MGKSILIQQSEEIAKAIEKGMKQYDPGINIGIMTTNDLELNDRTLWGDHLLEIREPEIPVDAESFVDYWLKNRGNMGVKDIFVSYYESAMNQYIKEHTSDINAWDRNLAQEFVRTVHLSAEKAGIQQSLARLSQLSEAERKQAESLSINYLTFVRKERMKRYPIEHPADRMLEETFFDPYRAGGAATLCMEWLRVKHDICWDSLESGAPQRILLSGVSKGTYTYNVFIPAYVKEEMEDFKSPERFHGFEALEQEIQNNLDQCQDGQQRMKYLCSLLKPFEEYAHAFNPKAKIKRCETRINKAQQLIKEWETVEPDAINKKSGLPLNPQHYIDRLRKAIESMEKEIAFQKQFQNHFLKYSCQGCTSNPSDEEQTMCIYLNFWRRQMYDFVQMLLPIASRYGISISEIQKQSGIYVLDADDLNDATDSSLVPHTDKPVKTSASKHKKQQKKRVQAKAIPFTLDYLEKSQAVCQEQKVRISMVDLFWKLWGWISKESEADDLERFFSGQQIHCNLKWKARSYVLTKLIRELREQPYIKPQTRCSVNAIIMGQFERKPDHNAKRCTEIDSNRIELTCKLLSLEINPKTLITSYCDKKGIDDEDLSTLAQYEVLCRNMHVRKSV